MFSWNVYSTWDNAKFILTVPLHYIMCSIALFFILIGLLFALKSGHAVRNLLVIAAALIAFGFLTYSSQLTLDRAAGTATLREFQYYHWSTVTYPLKEIDRIFVRTGSTTSQLNIQFTGGSTTSFDFLDQNGGKDEAAYAANHWLGNGK